MSLRELEGKLRDEYRTGSSDLIKDFYVPCLERSQFYHRAVGFFASSSLSAAATGLRALITSGGRMKLIASPCLSAEDINAIKVGLSQREERIEQSILAVLEQEFDAVIKDKMECLSWLLANGALDIKLAIPSNADLLGSIYHEKVGIFGDADGSIVSFTGSANESASALIGNFECIDVFVSWDEGVRLRALKKAQHFDLLWSNQTPAIDVLEFPEAARKALLRLMPKRSPAQSDPYHHLINSVNVQAPASPRIPTSVILRPYQEQAIANWLRNKARGTLKMATGSGKTIIALAAATQLYRKMGLQGLLIVCPYRHLVDQWAREANKFGLEPVLAYQSASKWEDVLTAKLYDVRSGHQKFIAVITTNATLMSSSMQSLLEFFPKRSMIVGDEVHNLGAPRLISVLPQSFSMRLGLSATPERYFDEEGTEAIVEYFGAVLQPEFTLRDAIDAGALVHYLYYPIIVELTNSEAEEYEKLTRAISKLAFSTNLDQSDPVIKSLLMKRARLIGAASNKLVELRELMLSRVHQNHTLFYCGDGTVEDEDSSDDLRQVDAVAHILNDELGFKAKTYTFKTPLYEREILRQDFDRGKIQGLVAVRCLDEGVDIPSIQTAVLLASSANPRQFIQRRGRILRLHPTKSRAELFDMIVAPPASCMGNYEIERSLLRKELVRFVEFADLADNNGEARLNILQLQKRFGLLDI